MKEDWELVKGRRELERGVREMEEKPSYINIFTNRKYRAGSIFLVIAPVIAQLTGVNAINIYSAEILSNNPNMP